MSDKKSLMFEKISNDSKKKTLDKTKFCWTDKEKKITFDDAMVPSTDAEADPCYKMSEDMKANMPAKYADHKCGPNCTNVEMLRTGKFSHPWWGIINIDKSQLDMMQKNFSDDIVGKKITYDLNHDPRQGAFAELISTDTIDRPVKNANQTFLRGHATFSDEGKQLIDNKKYEYFSIEYFQNYSDTEVFDTFIDQNGIEQPLGDLKYYGPTIVGGALTNRPFIPNMNQLEFSELSKDLNPKDFCYLMEDEIVETSGIKNNPVLPSIEHKKLDTPIISEQKKPEVVKNIFDNYGKFKSKGEIKMGLAATIKFMENKLTELKPDSDDYKFLLESIEDSKKELEEVEATNQRLKTAEERNKKLSVSIDKQAATIAELKENQDESRAFIAEEKAKNRRLVVKTFTNSLYTQGIPKPTIEVAKQFILCDKDNKKMFKIEDGDNKGEYSLMEIIEKLFSSMPKNSKLVPLDTNRTKIKDDDEKEVSLSSDFETEDGSSGDKTLDEAAERGHQKAMAEFNKKTRKNVDSSTKVN